MLLLAHGELGLGRDEAAALTATVAEHLAEDGWRLDEFDKNSIRFDKDESGAIAFMTIDAANRFERK